MDTTQEKINNDFPVVALNIEPVDIDQIKLEADQFLKTYPFNPTQVCLNDRGISESFSAYEGLGTAFDDESKKLRFQEKDFIRWAPELHDTELLKSIKKIENLGLKLGRARLMSLKPRSCYSFHFDMTERIHLVIQPDPRAVMIFPPNIIVNIPYDRRFHLVNTTQTHTAMNGGNNERIHLVIALAE